ncbi:MAG: LLM class flavin-dependent oxidoreductase [Haloarculaceae archaeon]
MTTLPRTGIALPEYESWTATEQVEFAVEAVDAGFESVWCGDGWGYSSVPLLARVADRTDCVLGTLAANVFARSPGSLAMDAATLHEATDGQFVLGVGTSTPNIVEGFHGAAFERPLRRLRETIEIVELALSGERVNYDGEIFSVEGFRMHLPQGPASVPVFNAALGPTNVALSVEHADGLITHMLPLAALDDAVAEGEARAGETADLHRMPSVITSVHEDPTVARSTLAAHVAAYVGPADPYNDVVARHGYSEAAAAIREAWERGGREAAAEAVPQSLLEAVGVVGTPAEVREQYRALADGPADTVLTSFPQGATEEMIRLALEAIPVGEY